MTFCVKYRKLSTIETDTVLLLADEQSRHHRRKHCPKMTTKTKKQNQKISEAFFGFHLH